MRIDDLFGLAENTKWFSCLGQSEHLPAKIVHIESLDAWAGLPSASREDRLVAEAMDWLPSSFDQIDPFDDDIDIKIRTLGRLEEAKNARLRVSKVVTTNGRVDAEKKAPSWSARFFWRGKGGGFICFSKSCN